MVALMMNVEPILTLIAARLLVSEDLTWLQYMGMLIAIIGISLGGFRRSAKNIHRLMPSPCFAVWGGGVIEPVVLQKILILVIASFSTFLLPRWNGSAAHPAAAVAGLLLRLRRSLF